MKRSASVVWRLATTKSGPVLDTALIAAAQNAEHCEIASYGSLVALAKPVGRNVRSHTSQ
ncbi:DUF892 family protein [Paraburkholderia strydomiana]|uniref:DUF892 family protein n=1 Tax=Paraburkholderia strydomiana TaxID=1245417 RepID=UPI0038B9D4E3